MGRHQGKAVTITPDQAKGGYAPELRPSPPVLSTPTLHGFSPFTPQAIFFVLLVLLPSCTKKPQIPLDVPVVAPVEEVVQVLPEEPVELNGGDPALAVVKGEPVFKAAYFDFDGVEIRSDAREELENWKSGLYKLEGAGVVLEGHCDFRGSSQYNFGLGMKRAVAVKRYLESQGVGNKIRCVSYGENRPAREWCETEECLQENRRVELRIEKGGME